MYYEQNVGVKAVAAHFNGLNILRRVHKWGSQTIHHVLTNATYKGELIFNKACWKTGVLKPEDQWVRIPVDAIIDAALFDIVQQKLHSRNRDMSHPKLLASPRLLTGVLKCGVCGANMVLATGKNNQYRYYKCSNKIRKQIDMCSSKPVSMEGLDQFILKAFCDQVLVLDRVAAMLAELKQRKGGISDMKALVRQLEGVKAKITNVYNAIEEGDIAIDDMLKERITVLRNKRQEIEHKIEQYSGSQVAMMDSIDTALVKTFCEEARKKLTDPTSKFAKDYLQLLVSEIVLTESEVKFKGKYGALVGAVKFSAEKKLNLSTSDEVLRFNQEWRPLADALRTF